MNVAKCLLLTLLALPFLELAAFIIVAATIGFVWALGLLVAASLAGMLVLRHAGGSHIARMRIALDRGSFAALQADSSGGLILIAGILLLVPGFITDFIALALLVAPLRRTVSAMFSGGASPRRNDGIVDLPPEQWHQVPDPALPNRRKDEGEH